jgi:ankyrin repeat protein
MGAADAGDVLSVGLLIDAGAKLDTRDRHGNTAVLVAAAHGHRDVLARLTTAGADVRARDPGRLAPYQRADAQGHLENVSLCRTAAGLD